MKRQSGFTLIEALIAGLILFAVIASMTALYQGATVARIKAGESVRRAAVVPFLMDHIRYAIRHEKMVSDQGVMQGVRYQWNAVKQETGTAYIESGLESLYSVKQDRFVLWQVTLELDGKQRFVFKEFSW